MNLHEFILAKQLASKNNAGNVDLSDYYTKSQTDQRISSKVAEIVADAPEDFDTLKELSDWIESHEDSAAAMNTAIAANTTAIMTKVDKVSGKGLSTNDFTTASKTKLDGLENYDDTEMKKEIVKISEQTALNRSTLGYQRKNLLKLSAVPNNIQQVSWTPNGNGTITVNGTAYDNSDYYIAGDWHSSKKVIERGDFIVSCEGLVSGLKMIVLDYSDGTMQKAYSVGAGTEVRITGVQITGVYLQLSKNVKATNVVVKPMIRSAEITDETYEPYRPSVVEYIASLEERISALESVNLTANSINSSLNTTEINTTEEEIL